MVKGLVPKNYSIFQTFTKNLIPKAYFGYKILYYLGFSLRN